MEFQRFKAGDKIFTEGEPSDVAYIVEYGNVVIYRESQGRHVRLAVLGKGAVFGEMGLIDDRPRSASAQALNDVALTPMSSERFFGLLHSDPEAIVPIICFLFERLRLMNDRYVESLERSGGDDMVVGDYRAKLVPLTRETERAISRAGLNIDSFPFRIGRTQTAGETSAFDWNDLAFADTPPFNLSRNHFVIERTEQGLLVRDRGSLHGTMVNGERIGGLKGKSSAILSPGANEVVAGNDDSPYRFRLVVEHRPS